MFQSDIIERIKLPFKKEKELYSSFYKILGFYPKDIQFYKQALMHKSLTFKDKKGKRINNERLEFLGDAILDAIIGDIVYRRFEGKKEGFLTNARSKIVQRESLNKIALDIGLDKLIQYAANTGNNHNNNMWGNAFEALVGAIYLDRGYDYCMRFMNTRILEKLIFVDSVAYKEVNFKSKLIEWSQKNKIQLNFDLQQQSTDEQGAPIFNTQIILEGIACGAGKGYSKKESQQQAAKETLEKLRKTGFASKIFEAKAKRTAMEENPVMAVPQITPAAQQEAVAGKKEEKPAAAEEKESAENPQFDLSDIQMSPKKQNKEEIIAAAEAAAFQE